MKKKCCVCSGGKNNIIFVENSINILKCENCGHIYSSFVQRQDYDGYFGDEKRTDIDSFWWNDAHKKMYEDFCKKFIRGKSGRLLDVGSGLGYFVKKISEDKGWKAEGYEISKYAVNYSNKELGLENIYCGKVEESNYPPKYFDIITMWDVVEHIPDPNPILKYLFKVLKDDGFLFIHTPNIRIQLPKAKLKYLFSRRGSTDIHYLEAKDHINIYSPNTIKKVLQNNGFNNIDLVHLHPIQSVSGSKNSFSVIVKNLWYNISKVVYGISFKKINLDNLFVIAKK